MPEHAEQRYLPYTPEKLFDLVADIERYPDFLPWCVGAEILDRVDNIIVADLMIGFKFIRETFTSEVILTAPTRIDVNYQKGPFKFLRNYWKFETSQTFIENLSLTRVQKQQFFDYYNWLPNNSKLTNLH